MANIIDRLNAQTAQYMGLPKVPPKGQFTTQWKATPAQRMMQNEAALSRQMANDQVLLANVPAQFRNQIGGRGPLFNFGTRTGAGASGLPDPRAQVNPGSSPGAFGASNPLGNVMGGRPQGLASKGGGLGGGGGGGGGGSSSAGASRPQRPSRPSRGSGSSGGGGSGGQSARGTGMTGTGGLGPEFGKATGANPDYRPGGQASIAPGGVGGRTSGTAQLGRGPGTGALGGGELPRRSSGQWAGDIATAKAAERASPRLGGVAGATGRTSGLGSVSVPMRNTQFNAMSGPGEKTMQGENVRVGQKSTQPGADVSAFWKKKKSGPGSKGSKG